MVVGLHLDFDYHRMAAAATAVRAGARLVATNDDTTYPAADGVLLPGAGSILAVHRDGLGAEPIVAGKPYVAMADLVREPGRARPASRSATGPTPTAGSRPPSATRSAWC